MWSRALLSIFALLEHFVFHPSYDPVQLTSNSPLTCPEKCARSTSISMCCRQHQIPAASTEMPASVYECFIFIYPYNGHCSLVPIRKRYPISISGLPTSRSCGLVLKRRRSEHDRTTGYASEIIFQSCLRATIAERSEVMCRQGAKIPSKIIIPQF